MANFNEKFEAGGVPDFTNRVRIPKSNLAANLFSAFGKVAQAGLQQQENNQKFELSSALSSIELESTKASTAAIVSGLPDTPSGPGVTNPLSDNVVAANTNADREIKTAGERFSRAKVGVDQGFLTARDFAIKKGAEIKRLKEKFTTKEAHAKIDRSMVISANEEYRAAVAEAKAVATASNKRQAAWDKLTLDTTNARYLGDNYPDIRTNPEKYDNDAVRGRITQELIQENGRLQEMRNIILEADVDKAVRARNITSVLAKIRKSFRKVADTGVITAQRMIGEVDPGLLDGRSSINSQEATLLAQRLQFRGVAIRNQMMLEAREVANIYDLTNKQLKETIDGSMEMFDGIVSLISSEDYTSANMVSAMVKAKQDDLFSEIMKNPVAAMASISSKFPALKEVIDVEIGRRVNDVSKLISTAMTGKLVTEEMNLSQSIDLLNGVDSMSNKQKGASIKTHLEDSATILKSSEASPENYASFVDKVYNDRNIIDKFVGRTGEQVWQMLTHPDILSRIKKDPENLARYSIWVKRQPQLLASMKTLADNTSTSLGTVGDFGQVTVQPDGRLSFVVDREGLDRFFADPSVLDIRKDNMRKALLESEVNVNQLNRTLSPVLAVAKVNGEDLDKAMSQTLSNMRVNLEGDSGSFISTVSRMVEGVITTQEGARTAEGEGAKSREELEKEFLPMLSLPGNEGVILSQGLEGTPTILAPSGPSRQTPLASGIANQAGEGIEDNPPGTVTEREGELITFAREDPDPNDIPEIEDDDNDAFEDSSNFSGEVVPIPQERPKGLKGPKQVTVNQVTNPLIHGLVGASKFVKKGADKVMGKMLAAEFSTLSTSFKSITGKDLVISDGIAKEGTSRETGRQGSRHFVGDALDISISGLSDQEQRQLVVEARKAGFTGFGFGSNIMHVDKGRRRAWGYGNPTFGGLSVGSLIRFVTKKK